MSRAKRVRKARMRKRQMRRLRRYAVEEFQKGFLRAAFGVPLSTRLFGGDLLDGHLRYEATKLG